MVRVGGFYGQHGDLRRSRSGQTGRRQRDPAEAVLQAALHPRSRFVHERSGGHLQRSLQCFYTGQQSRGLPRLSR